MAIQIPNPGTGNGATGDNEFVLWSKVKDNFSDQTNAASRLVGISRGKIPLADDAFAATYSVPMKTYNSQQTDLNSLVDYPLGSRIYLYHVPATVTNYATEMGSGWSIVETISIHTGVMQSIITTSKTVWRIASTTTNPVWSAWHVDYSTRNTKLDTNGAISPSSPTIDLYSDRIETNSDGSRMNPEFVRNGVGDYTIKNTTGLRDEGWYIKIPNDMNGNPKVAVAVDTDKDGNLSIKTYRRTFSMETFTFIPDLETPLDIPEGRWIDLRFNDLPYENLDNIQPEEVDLEK